MTEALDLAQFDDDFAQQPIEEPEFEDIPDGRYQVAIDRVELTRSKQAGNPMLKWALKILGPTHRGRLLFRNNLIVSSDNLKWLKHDLHIAGLDLDRLSDLPGRLGELLDRKLEVTKKTKGDFENVFLNKQIVLAADVPAGDFESSPF